MTENVDMQLIQHWRERAEKAEAALARQAPAACPHGDKFCPCPDGDACHYDATKKTAAFQASAAVEAVKDLESLADSARCSGDPACVVDAAVELIKSAMVKAPAPVEVSRLAMEKAEQLLLSIAPNYDGWTDADDETLADFSAAIASLASTPVGEVPAGEDELLRAAQAACKHFYEFNETSEALATSEFGRSMDALEEAIERSPASRRDAK